MPTKTYNMGRVVGWSTYEEFLKENPNIDPSKVTSMVYSTMVTYGLTRIVTIPANASAWQPSQDTETTFYTATVEVPGATYGAVPVVGINYDYYIRTFKSESKKYSEATTQAGTNKELLEKAFKCIFTCYVSDANGVRVENSIVNSGYLTFAAHPDIIDYLEAVSALVAPETGLKVIVRGLSLSGFTDADDLYFGPEGLVICKGGSSESKYCEQDTIDISALCLSASGYIWMNTGGQPQSSGEALFTSVTNHPSGDVLISTFGYLSPELMQGTGAFADLGTYAFTYEQYLDIKNTPNLHINDVQVRALEDISSDEPKKYLYLIDGLASYEALPQAHNPLYAIPVRKSDYYVNVGTFDGLRPTYSNKLKLKKPFDMTRSINTDDQRVIVLSNKITPNYLGSYWSASAPSECKLTYWGNNSLAQSKWISDDIRGFDEVYYALHDRTTYFMIKDDRFPGKGDFIVLFNQPEYKFNGLYQCVRDESEDHAKLHTFIRRGAYLSISVPTWVTQKTGDFCWKVDLSSVTTSISDGVLLINNTPIYPGELLITGVYNNHHEYFVLNTITNNSPELILATNCVFPVEINDPDVLIANAGTEWANYIMIEQTDFRDIVTSMTKTVYTDATNTYSFTLTNTTFTPGLLFDIKHKEATAYGYNTWYRYTLTKMDNGVYQFASCEVWTANTNLSTVTGHPGTQNSAFPSYNQTLPNEKGNWYYNVPAALAHTPAKKMFQDFGYDIADYVHEDFQDISLGKFLQECVLRTDLTTAATDSTVRTSGIESTIHLYSKDDLNYTSGNVPAPTASSPISASLILHASTSAKSYFSTAYYTATLKNGTPININNPDYPIWASVSKSPEGTEIMSVSVTDNSGSQLDFSGNSGTIAADTVTWLDLLVGLGSGKSVDVLKGARFGKDDNDCNYIQTADGTRLYISTTEPTGDIPDGSIGIGW